MTAIEIDAIHWLDVVMQSDRMIILMLSLAGGSRTMREGEQQEEPAIKLENIFFSSLPPLAMKWQRCENIDFYRTI